MSRASLCALLLLPLAAPAQKLPQSPHATVIRPAPLYLQPDTASDKLTTVAPGRELSVLERSGPWLRVQTNTDDEKVRAEDQPVFTNEPEAHSYTGWIEDKTAVTTDTPNGEAILFGEAISFEQAAAAPRPPADAAQTARRLYRLDAELFPAGAPPKPPGAPPTSAGSSKRRTQPHCPPPTRRKPTCASFRMSRR